MKIEAIKKMLVKEGYDGEQLDVALVLLSAANVGAFVNKVTKFSKLEKEKVVSVFKKALKAKIFKKNGQVDASDGWTGENSGISFALDVACVMGLLKRTNGKGVKK